MPSRKKPGRPGARQTHVRVKTAKGRKLSSTRWLQRQLNDPYVAAARREGFRSRAAFKLVELNEKFGLLAPGRTVVDLGAAPGGWTQVAVAGVGDGGRVLAVDIVEMDPVPGATTLACDIGAPDAVARVRAALDGPVDLVLSDMAPPATGHRGTDHLRIMALVEAAADLAMQVLSPGGAFVAKVWQGGTENALLADLKRRFGSVRHAKPAASRADSAELYLIATGFRGADDA